MTRDLPRPARRADAFIRMIGIREAQARGGALAEAYAQMAAAGESRPAVYSTPDGEAPNIVRCHSLDPEALRLAFSLSATIHWGDAALPWATREMIHTVTSWSNDCFY